MSRRETNPHFSRPQRLRHEDHQQPPFPVVPHQQHHGQPPPDGGAPMQQEYLPDHPHFPLQPHLDEDRFPLHPRQQGHHQPLPISQAPPRDQRGQPPRGGGRRQQDQPYPPSKPRVVFQEPSSPKVVGSPVLPPPDHPPEPRQQHHDPHKQPHHWRRQRLPPPKKSNPLHWCCAVFCVIFWLTIIIGGLIVLIVYLVFRPQSPRFDVSSVTLNAAYLDFGYLLNADITILANFTNPNKKVHVDFSSVIIYLYYGSTLIASQYVEPFSAARVQSRFAYIHMITSQVQLPLGESQRLLKQMESNGVLFQVRGVFRARSKLGSILRYSYNLYGLCGVMVTRPPDGIMLKKKCRTKR